MGTSDLAEFIASAVDHFLDGRGFCRVQDGTLYVVVLDSFTTPDGQAIYSGTYTVLVCDDPGPGSCLTWKATLHSPAYEISDDQVLSYMQALEKAGFGPADLDEYVHEVYSYRASNQNNSEMPDTMRFLLEEIGVKGMDEIFDELGVPLPEEEK